MNCFQQEKRDGGARVLHDVNGNALYEKPRKHRQSASR